MSRAASTNAAICAIKIESKIFFQKMDQYVTNNNRPTNLFCTANIVENLFIVTNSSNILLLIIYRDEIPVFLIFAMVVSPINAHHGPHCQIVSCVSLY